MRSNYGLLAAVAVALMTAIPAGARASDPKPAAIPVHTVTLFSSGVVQLHVPGAALRTVGVNPTLSLFQ